MTTANPAPRRKASPGKSRAKPRMPKAERRVQLLRVAYEIIAQEGIGALNMSVLAERSGAVKPVVYEHFENTQEVIFCLIDEYFQESSRYVLTRNEDSKSIHDFMEKSIDAMFDFHREKKFNLKIITNGFSVHTASNNLFFQYGERAVSFWKALLEQQGVIPAKAEISANIIYELLLGVTNDYASRKDADEAKAILKQLMNGFVGSLAMPAGQKPVPPVGSLRLGPN